MEAANQQGTLKLDHKKLWCNGIIAFGAHLSYSFSKNALHVCRISPQINLGRQYLTTQVMDTLHIRNPLCGALHTAESAWYVEYSYYAKRWFRCLPVELLSK